MSSIIKLRADLTEAENNLYFKDAEISRLQRQNAELVAKVARLENAQSDAIEYIGSLTATPMTIRLYDIITRALEESPAQSLQHIEAAAVEKFIRERFDLNEATLLSIANIKSLGVAHNIQLRQQSTNGSDGDE